MSPAEELAFSVSVTDDGVVIVSGEVDLSTSPELDVALQAAVERSSSALTVDLTEVAFLDSAGVNALVRVVKTLEASGRTLVLRGSRPNVRRALELSGAADFATLL